MNKVLKDYLAGEFDIAIQGLRDNSRRPDERLYMMSASFGALSRVLNIEYDRNLVFAHFVLQNVHTTINGLLSHGNAGAYHFDVDLLDSLADALEELGHTLLAGDSIASVLSEMVEIGFTSTGNGNYLYQKGLPAIRRPKSADQR